VVSLRGIAAGSAKQIWVVGETVTTATIGVDTPLVERSTGGSFKPVSIRGLAAGAHLEAVAASSATNAWAMGGTDDGSASYTLHWNGKKWKKSSLTVNGSVFAAEAVSTSSSRNAWAVGTAGTAAVIIHWNGSRWSVSETLPIGQSLTDIVTTGSHAWAVGSVSSTTGNHPLAVRLTSAGWRTIALKRSPVGLFDGVTAVGATAYAVGRTSLQNTTGAQTPVAARLSGAKGTYLAIKKKGDYSAALDVAASTKSVLAVGLYTPGAPCSTPSHPLAEQLVRNKWKLATVPARVAPAGGTGSTCL
jgi:hypothetical protein